MVIKLLNKNKRKKRKKTNEAEGIKPSTANAKHKKESEWTHTEKAT